MLKRARVYYSGQVQGVGFRYTALGLAQESGLTGWIKNLLDSRVELVCEGEEVDIKNFLEKVKADLNYCLFKESITWEKYLGEFNKFEIRY